MSDVSWTLNFRPCCIEQPNYEAARAWNRHDVTSIIAVRVAIFSHRWPALHCLVHNIDIMNLIHDLLFLPISTAVSRVR